MFNFQGHSDPNENQTFDRFHKEYPNVLSGYLFFAIMRSDVNDYLSTQNLPDVGTRIKTYLRETIGIDGRRALGFASEYFPVSHANDHFVINSIQLGFMFDVVYTKASLIYTKLGCFLRLTSFTSSFSVLLLFFINIINEPKFHGSRIDIATTGILLSGAIAQELYAAWIMLSSYRAVLVAEFHHNVYWYANCLRSSQSTSLAYYIKVKGGEITWVNLICWNIVGVTRKGRETNHLVF
ncbi:hypothetical protein SLE2022_025920 [Rubroshorea leprosula]